MRTTTICRSSALLAAFCLAAPLALSGQTPPPIQRPINQAREAVNQTNAQTAAQQANQQPTAPGRVTIEGSTGVTGGIQMQNPGTHVVVQGETLWGLAQQFLGDPMLWPEIYRLNTDVVEDPHWIYPGEELRLGPAPVTSEPIIVDQGLAINPRDTTPVAPARYSTTGPTIFSQQTAVTTRLADIELRERNAYRAVREGEYFSSGFLTEGQRLNSGRILANLQTATLGNIRTRETAYQFEDVIIDLPPGETVQPGDLLLSFRRGDETANWGEIIRPTGLLRYRGPAGDRHRATILRQFSQIGDGQELLKVGGFSFNTSARAQPVAAGIQGSLIAQREPREVVIMQDVIFIDKGETDGVRLGDIFQVYRTNEDVERGGRVEQDQARALIVNTRSRTATAIIIDIYRGDVGTSSSVRQIRRMPN